MKCEDESVISLVDVLANCISDDLTGTVGRTVSQLSNGKLLHT